METTSKRNDENKIELTITFSADEVQKKIDNVYKTAGKTRIPGFRPGKAPRRVLDNYYGGKTYFLAQATEDLIEGNLSIAIDQAGFVPLDKPDLSKVKIIEEGQDFILTTSFTVRPLLEISSYDPVQIELPGTDPTTEEIDNQIDVMLQYYMDYKDVTDRPIQEKDLVYLELDVKAGDKIIEALTGENIPYRLNTGSMPADFDEQLIGMKIGEKREFDFKLSPDDKTWMGDVESAHAAATLHSIKEIAKPELTDEWVKEKLEFDSAQDFRNRIIESLRVRKRNEIEKLKEKLVLEELIARLEGEPPTILVTQLEQDMYRDFFSSLQENNQTLDAYLLSNNISAEVFRADVKKRATAFAAQGLALDAVARKLGLEATDVEIKDEFISSGAEDPEALYQKWKDNGRLSEIRESLLRIKASKYVVENAEVFEVGKKPTEKKAAKKADKAEKPEKAEKAKKPEKPEKSEKPEKATKETGPTKLEKPVKVTTKKKTENAEN